MTQVQASQQNVFFVLGTTSQVVKLGGSIERENGIISFDDLIEKAPNERKGASAKIVGYVEE